MTDHDNADTDPAGPPVLLEESEGPLQAREDEEDGFGPDALEFSPWPEPLPERELTREELKEELALHDRLMIGLGLTRVNNRRREELVEARMSGGRDFVVYSGVAEPAARTLYVADVDAPTMVRRRRRPRLSWRLAAFFALATLVAPAAVVGRRLSSRTAAIPVASAATSAELHTEVRAGDAVHDEGPARVDDRSDPGRVTPSAGTLPPRASGAEKRLGGPLSPHAVTSSPSHVAVVPPAARCQREPCAVLPERW